MSSTSETKQGQIGLTLLRVTLGIIILVTWFDNLNKGLYTADGLNGFFNYLFSPEGNASSLLGFKAFLDIAVVPVAGLFAKVQLVAELLMALSLIFGAFTRLFGYITAFFFINIFLSYFGGHEWIWTYVLLISASFAVALGGAGRFWGVDQWLLKTRGEPPYPVLW